MVVGRDQQEEGKERDIKKEGLMGEEGGKGGMEGGGRDQGQAEERGL